MDESKDGVVYFTFGSMVVIETLPKDTLKIIYASLAKIAPVRVLMKVANETNLPPGLSKNVMHLPWIPQQAVLGNLLQSSILNDLYFPIFLFSSC